MVVVLGASGYISEVFVRELEARGERFLARISTYSRTGNPTPARRVSRFGNEERSVF
jgi:uncharacterized protein YbjT (DUF2867 family)